MKPDFGYLAVLKSDMSGETTSIIAHQTADDGPLQAVLWSVSRRRWIYAPALAVRFLYDDQYRDRSKRVSRQEAESIAEHNLGVLLPSESQFRELCEEGSRLGWDFGPPRTPGDSGE